MERPYRDLDADCLFDNLELQYEKDEGVNWDMVWELGQRYADFEKDAEEIRATLSMNDGRSLRDQMYSFVAKSGLSAMRSIEEMQELRAERDELAETVKALRIQYNTIEEHLAAAEYGCPDCGVHYTCTSLVEERDTLRADNAGLAANRDGLRAALVQHHRHYTFGPGATCPDCGMALLVDDVRAVHPELFRGPDES